MKKSYWNPDSISFIKARLDCQLINNAYNLLQKQCHTYQCMARYYTIEYFAGCITELCQSALLENIDCSDECAVCQRCFEESAKYILRQELTNIRSFIDTNGIFVTDDQLIYMMAKSFAIKTANRDINKRYPSNREFLKFADDNQTLQINMVLGVDNLSDDEQKELNRLLQKANYYNNIIKEVKSDGSNN